MCIRDRDLRVNTFTDKRADVRKELAAAGIQSTLTPYSPWGLRIEGKPALTKLDAFARGAIEVQDEGSQLLALLLEASSSSASSWEPSSCTSIAPRAKASSLVSAGLPSMRRPQGEYGVSVDWMPAAASSLRTSARLSVKVLTRRSLSLIHISEPTRPY